jgi:Trehalase
MSERMLEGTADRPKGIELSTRALEVLESNWLGHGTRPSRLYPHQWSWDSACIAMGYAGWNQARAETELRSLFAGQWANGLVPHIVFAEGDGRYFPGPEFWQTERSPEAPANVRTSGIAQPPIHATAVLRVFQQSSDRDRALAFLAELAPRLRAWHAYLYRERTRDGGGLVEIWHPWESGMDNSPLWDDALARIELTPAQVPEYTRVDVELANPAERPTDEEYDRYVYLVGLFRDLDYRADRIQAETPFALQSVLFNSLLIQANRDLAEIAQVLGDDPAQYTDWAESTALELDTRLWNEPDALYADYDLEAGKHVTVRSAAGLAPLYARVPSVERARRMVERLADSRVEVDASGWAVTSLAPDDPGYLPTLYWRGPIWPILNWVLQRGLDRYGYATLAAQVRRALIDLSGRNGFWEHYNPATGAGHGGENFAWTAGLVLDILSTETEAEEGPPMEDAAITPGVDGSTTSSDERRD